VAHDALRRKGPSDGVSAPPLLGSQTVSCSGGAAAVSLCAPPTDVGVYDYRFPSARMVASDGSPTEFVGECGRIRTMGGWLPYDDYTELATRRHDPVRLCRGAGATNSCIPP